MVGLLDIAPVTENVDIGNNQSIPVTGVTVEGIAYLLQHFPQFAQLQSLMGGGDKDLAAVLFSLGPQVIATIIAAGCVNPVTEEAIQKAAGLNVQAQADLLDAVLRKTLTKGLDPFVARLESIKATLAPPAKLSDKVREAQLAKRKPSPKTSNSFDGQDIQPQTSGA